MRTMEKEDDPRTERNKCNDKTHEVKMNDDNWCEQDSINRINNSGWNLLEHNEEMKMKTTGRIIEPPKWRQYEDAYVTSQEVGHSKLEDNEYWDIV